jgi:hypothetical protein
MCAALAGCGSVVASNSAAPAAGAANSGTTSAEAAASAAPQVGCASVNQASAVTIRRNLRLEVPVEGGMLSVTDHNRVQVQALFRDLCNAVTHPDNLKSPVHCPIAFGTYYAGTFFDGQRVLATFTYTTSGCQRVSLNAAGKTQATMMAGQAAAAAPHLLADMDTVLKLKPGHMQPLGQVSAGGPTSLRQVAGFVEVELAVLDSEDERLPLGLGEVQLVAVGVGRIVHHVQLGLTGLVRRGRRVGGDVHLDPPRLGQG